MTDSARPDVSDDAEVDFVDSEEPLRQGDVIMERSLGVDVFRRTGVVVTADCHLAKKKHRGSLNFVPLLPSGTYLALTDMDDYLQTGRQRAQEEIHRCIRTAHSEVLGRPSTITQRRAVEWLMGAPFADVQRALLLEPGGATSGRLELLVRLLQSHSDLSFGSLAESRDLLVRYCEADIGMRSFGKIADQVSKRIKELPMDALFLNGGCELNERHGYVCYLRLMQRVDDKEISLTDNPFLDQGERLYRRVGRLRSPFVYHLTQSLGYVYSTIGLPEVYEEAREEAVVRLRAKLEDG